MVVMDRRRVAVAMLVLVAKFEFESLAVVAAVVVDSIVVVVVEIDRLDFHLANYFLDRCYPILVAVVVAIVDPDHWDSSLDLVVDSNFVVDSIVADFVDLVDSIAVDFAVPIVVDCFVDPVDSIVVDLVDHVVVVVVVVVVVAVAVVVVVAAVVVANRLMVVYYFERHFHLHRLACRRANQVAQQRKTCIVQETH